MRRTLALLAVSAAVLASCSGADPRPSPTLASRAQRIIDGQPDTTHHAVVAVLAQQSVCSGTIVAVSGATGWVLTAAHCCDPHDRPRWITVAGDYDRATHLDTYDVSAVKADPAYDGQVHDFCMVSFSGAGAATPAPIPVLTPQLDDLHVGTSVSFSGYGITNADPGSTGYRNSVREQVDGTLSQLDAWTVAYDQAVGGPCSGDSGGPALYERNGQLWVAAVTSYGDEACTRYGVSGRASAAWAGFIQPVLDGKAPPPAVADCTSCSDDATGANGACAPDVQACLDDGACGALVRCFGDCGPADRACVDGCVEQHQAGLAAYRAISDCICTTACAQLCANECGAVGEGGAAGTGGAGAGGSGGAPAAGGAGGEETAGAAGEPGTSSANRAAPGEHPSSGSCAVGQRSGSHAPAGGALVLATAVAGVAARRRRRP